MTITCNHPSSSYGIPVILDDGGEVMNYADGVKAIQTKAKLDNAALAKLCGVSPRTVDGWRLGRPPNAAALNVMSDLV